MKAAAADNPEQEAEDEERDVRGHHPVKVLQLSGIRSGWRCTLCRKMSSKKELLTSKKCLGCPLVKWSKIERDSEDKAPPMPVQQHRRMSSGSVLWCFRCGVYADKKAKGLKDICKGKPPRQTHRGGMEGQLRKLRNGIHPKTGACLPPPVELDPVVMQVRETASDEGHKVPEGFYVYEPIVLPPAATATVAEGQSSTDRRKALLDRIRAKERANSELMETTSIGDKVDLMSGSGGSQPLAPLTRPVLGGGVWDYLFPGERQHNSTMAQVEDKNTCRGKYRIRAKGAACHGRACCEGA